MIIGLPLRLSGKVIPGNRVTSFKKRRKIVAKWLELMRTGVFKDRHNIDRTISQEKLETIARNYKPGQASILVGHPDKPTVPSFGIIDALKIVGNKLMFLPGKVVPEFAALVRKGGFPDVSAGLNATEDNLSHVAFLSAEAPAIDGLTPICEFASNGDNASVSIAITDVIKNDLPEFASSAENWLQWRVNDVGRILRNVKNWLIDKEGQEKADQIVPEYQIEGLAGDIPAPITSGVGFSASADGQPNTALADASAKIAELTTANNALTVQLAEFSASSETLKSELAQVKQINVDLQAKVDEYKRELRSAEFSVFVETLIGEGRVLPDQKEQTIKMLETMHQATPAEFSSANGELSPLEQYKNDLKTRPVVVPSGEEKNPEFSGSASTDPVDIGKRARNYIDEQKTKGITVNVIDAVKHCMGK